jgi:hypothetical protein
MLSKTSTKNYHQATHAWIFVSLFFYLCLFSCLYRKWVLFISSVNLADFDISMTYSKLGSIIKVSRIILQVKVGNNSNPVFKL